MKQYLLSFLLFAPGLAFAQALCGKGQGGAAQCAGQKELPQYNEVAPLYVAFSPALKNSLPGRFYGEMLQGLKLTAIGTEAPNFTQQTPDGKQVSLAD